MSTPLVDLYQVRFTSQVDIGGFVVEHLMQHWAKPVGGFAPPGTPAANVNFEQRDGNPRPMNDWCTDLINSALDFWDTAWSLIGVELWSYPANSQNASFVTSFALTATGTNASPVQPAQLTVGTARSLGGRIMKMYVSETVNTNNTVTPWIAGSANARETFGTVLFEEDETCWVDREGMHAFTGLRFNPGQSEAVFKTRFRDN